MDVALLREIAQEFLLPFFSGADIHEQEEKSHASDALTELLDENNIAFKVAPDDAWRLILHRRQPFSREADVVPETSVVSAFVNALAEMQSLLTGTLKRDLLSTLQRRIVARSVAANDGDEAILLAGIDRLAAWSNRLYEGSPISAAIGFRHRSRGPNTNFTLAHFDGDSSDFGAVLSNGHDTLLEFNFDGHFLGHVTLTASDPDDVPYCPFRQNPIAEWTTQSERRVALTLNRLGEILVFRDQQLLFARRSGRWSFLTHRPIITQMGPKFNRKIRSAVYTSCLDASFARTGACIGIIAPENASKLSDVVHKDDLLNDSGTDKIRALRRVISNRRFHVMDRRLRQELLAIDGATVISDEGDLLAVGAIVRIPGGSTGGGRLAAARALSRLGLGVKVSQDGGITGFRQGRNGTAFPIDVTLRCWERCLKPANYRASAAAIPPASPSASPEPARSACASSAA